jgi:hypothetical protein
MCFPFNLPGPLSNARSQLPCAKCANAILANFVVNLCQQLAADWPAQNRSGKRENPMEIGHKIVKMKRRIGNEK